MLERIGSAHYDGTYMVPQRLELCFTETRSCVGLQWCYALREGAVAEGQLKLNLKAKD